MSFFLATPWVTFSLACAITLIISLIVTRFMIYFNISDIPVNRSSHTLPTPRAGGVGIIVSLFSGFIFAGFFIFPVDITSLATTWGNHNKVLLGLSLVVLISLADDIKHVNYKIRLGAQILAALLFYDADLHLNIPILDESSIQIPVEFMLTLIFFVFMSNAANFVDGLNGLLSGSILMWIPFAALINSPEFGGDPTIYPELAGSLLLLTFATLGFYLYNFPRARIFLGDVGSTFLGMVIALVAVVAQSRTTYSPHLLFFNGHFILTLFPLGFLGFDVVFTLMRRLYYKQGLTNPARDYLFHRLNLAGYSHTRVSFIYYGSVFVLGCLSLLTPSGYLPFLGLIGWFVALQSTFIAFVLWRTRHINEYSLNTRLKRKKRELKKRAVDRVKNHL